MDLLKMIDQYDNRGDLTPKVVRVGDEFTWIWSAPRVGPYD